MIVTSPVGTDASRPVRRHTLLLRDVLTPGVAVLLPALVSFVAWALPGGSSVTQGFTFRSHIGVRSFLLIAAWYAGCWVVLRSSCRAGRNLRPLGRSSSRSTRPGVDRKGYFLVTAVATAGVLYSLYRVSSIVSIVEILKAKQANALYAALPEGFGFQTLRYAAALSAAIGVHRVVLYRRIRPLTVWNLVLLSASALLASRLSIALFLLVFLYLLTQSHPHIRVRIWAVALGGLAFFLLLLPLSYSRNAGYYAQAGLDNPASVNAAQIWAYLSTPSQVAVGVSNAAVNNSFGGVGSPTAAFGVLRPTYLVSTKADKSVALDLGKYGYFVDVEPYYNTNSVFADTLARYGLSGLVAALSAMWLAGFVYGHLGQYGGLASCGAAVLLYAFVETWRVFLLNQGIIHFLVLIAVVLHMVSRGPRLDPARSRP